MLIVPADNYYVAINVIMKLVWVVESTLVKNYSFSNVATSLLPEHLQQQK